MYTTVYIVFTVYTTVYIVFSGGGHIACVR